MRIRPSNRQRLICLGLGLLAGVAGLPLLGSSMFQAFEQRTMDWRMTLRGAAEAAPEIVVCAIDAKSVNLLGQWPWPRSEIARLIRILDEAGAKAIALDIIFSEPSRWGEGEDEALAAALADAGNVVLGYYLTEFLEEGAHIPELLPLPVEVTITPPEGYLALTDYRGIETNIPLLTEAAPLGGQLVVEPDEDGTVRKYSLVVQYEDEMYPALALRGAQVFLDEPPIEVRPYDGVLPLITLGDLQIPATERGELWINYRGKYGSTFPYYSIADVLSGAVPAEALAGKLVFVGATETGIGDIKTSPFDRTVPGVEVHATVADNLLHRRFIRDGAPEALLGALAILLLGPLCGLSAVLFRRPLLGATALVVMLVLYGVATQVAFVVFSRHLFLFVPVLVGVTAYTGASVWRNLFSEAKARQIRKTFTHFVSEAVVSEMLDEPERVRLGGERRELTVLFTDIRGFTRLSEQMEPEEVVKLLNDFLTPMTRLLLDHGGTLDKYMGDAIMAFFGAPVHFPDHEQRACRTALHMRDFVGGLAASWELQGRPRVTSGVGISTGPMSVGNMGSEMIFDYTVIGDSVNLGSRLEGLTRVYNVDIIVGPRTHAKVQDEFCFRELDWVQVKGRVEPVTIYELLCEAEHAAPQQPLLDAFATGLAAYRSRDFEAAERAFRDAQRIRPDDGPTATYLQRVATLIETPPPADWDGVTSLTQK